MGKTGNFAAGASASYDLVSPIYFGFLLKFFNPASAAKG